MKLLKKENARMRKSYFTNVLTVLMIALISVGFVACGDDDGEQNTNEEQSYAGVDGIWIGTYYKYIDSEDSGESYLSKDGFVMVIDLNSNGTFTWVFGGADGDTDVFHGNWKREENVLTLTDHVVVYNYSILRWDDDVLVFSIIDDGEYDEYHFRKATKDDEDLLKYLK